jgi:cytoskeletal protein RodZ
MSESDSNPPKGPDAKSQQGGAPVGPAAPTEQAGDQSLGSFLGAARERRGVTRDEVVKQTRIPAHYIAMIESNNYSAISDQLYVLPFIRRYAEFLKLDSDEIAVRFVREVQRAESSVARMSEPIVERRRRRGHLRIWALTALALALMAAGWYLRSHRFSASFRSEPAAIGESSPATGAKAGEPILIAPGPSSGSNPYRLNPVPPVGPPVSSAPAPAAAQP